VYLVAQENLVEWARELAATVAAQWDAMEYQPHGVPWSMKIPGEMLNALQGLVDFLDEAEKEWEEELR